MIVDAVLGGRIEQALARQARDYALDHRAVLPDDGAEHLDLGDGGVAVWGSSRGAPNVSRAFALGLGGAVTEAMLVRAEAFYARHDEPTRVVTSPWTHPSLFGLLDARGYRVIGHDNVLARPIGGADAPPAPAAGITIHRVGQTPEEVLAWGRVVRVGFGMDADDPRFTAADRVFERSRTSTIFLACVDGEPAGGSALDLRDGIATLFATSTLPPYRRRGVQGALIAARLAHARSVSANVAVVLTEPGSDSQRNLESHHGFRVGYSTALFESTTPARHS